MDVDKATGVNYSVMDRFKRRCQERAAMTDQNARYLGLEGDPSSRGESAYVVNYLAKAERPFQRCVGFVDEGLGTKNLVADAVERALLADAMADITGRSYYGAIAQDTVAMAVNDLLTLGIFPVATSMHLAVGSDAWFADKARAEALALGWGDACDLASCIWGPGETSTLTDIILPEAAVLSASTWGVPLAERVDPRNIAIGDYIILLGSSGIHANGLSSARKLARRLSDGYETKLPDGSSFGEALLQPTHIYVHFLRLCIQAGVKFHYLVNVTGHGWRKLMRAEQDFTYTIHKVPVVPPVLQFLQGELQLTAAEAYAAFNMGAGFALFIAPEDWATVREVMQVGQFDFEASLAGRVEAPGPQGKRVVIKPLGIEYSAKDLQVR